MPRKPKTQSGRTAQGIEAIPGQMYGRGVEQEALQRVAPTPNARADVASQIAAGAAGGGAAAPAAPQMGFDQLLEAARGAGSGAGLLTAPTMRPDEPLTAGLPIGRGPGPEVLMTPRADPPGIRFLNRLSSITGDPYFADLARRSSR